MKMPGMQFVHKAQQTAEGVEQEANRVEVPMTCRLGSVDFLKQLFHQLGEVHTGAFAGNLAYHGLFAIFPFLAFLLSLLGIFQATSLVNALIKRTSTTMPAEATALLTKILHSVIQSHATGAFTVAAIIAILAALWGVSGAFRAVMEALNVMYHVHDSRPFWKRYLISIMLSIGVVVLLILALVLVVFGPAIGRALANQIGASSAFRWAWTILQWPLLLAFVLLAFSLVYRFAPDVEQQFRLVSPGAVAAIGLWLLFSLLFSLYVNTTTSYNRAYDALVGVAVFMLYLYYSAFILLVGAEVNQIIKEHAPDGKEKGEKVPKRHDGKGQDANQALHLVRETRPHQPEITGSRPFSQAPMGRAGDRRPV